jgi:DNA-binding SARP family transcriptional activator
VTSFDFRVLGPLEVRQHGELVVIQAPKQRALLALLLLHGNESVLPDELIDELWGEQAPRTARASLQNLVHALRKRLGPERLERGDGGYVLRVEPGELDLERFESLVAEARTAEPREKAARLRAALSLWRGAPLVEVPSEPFVQHEITRLEEERLSALEDRIDIELELGEHADLILELESLVDRYPLRERIWGQLMLALYRLGRQSDALATYGRARAVLVEELGVEPGEALRELQRAILRHDPELDDPGHRLGWTLERAAAILPWQPHDRAESLYDYALALMRTGETRRAVSTFEAAARTAAAVGEDAVEKRARLYLSYISVWTEGKSPLEHLAEAESATRWFEAHHDPKGVVTALRHRYQFLELSGRADAAAELASYAVSVAAESGQDWLYGGCLSERAWLVARGSTPVHEAIVACEELLTDEGEPRHVGANPLHLWAALGVLYAQAGRIDEARALGERAVSDARKRGLLILLPGAFSWRSQAELIVGNVADAVVHANSAYAIAEIEHGDLSLSVSAGELACLLALDGDHVRARPLALSARARASPDAFLNEVTWRRALALVAAKEGRTDEAITLSDEARTRAGAADQLTFRGQILEEAAIVRRLADDATGETGALEEALMVYERKGNVVGAERVRSALHDAAP